MKQYVLDKSVYVNNKGITNQSLTMQFDNKSWTFLVVNQHNSRNGLLFAE